MTGGAHLRTREETIADQSDLGALCADRVLETAEPFSHNAFYGIGEVLKTYAGVPTDRPLWAVVPHGVYWGDGEVHHTEANAPVPAVFSYPAYRDSRYASMTNKVVVPSASPFLYALAMARAQTGAEAPREGTIVFPAHSTHWVKAEMNHELLADVVSRLDDDQAPATVCLYWRDYNLGRARPYEDKGIRVVSAGHIYDSQFMFRLAHLLLSHEYAASNASGSHYFYARMAGCPHYHVDVAWSQNAPQEIIARDVSGPGTRASEIEHAERVFRTLGQSESQLALANYYLRSDCFGSPEQLRAAIEYCESLALRRRRPGQAPSGPPSV